MFNHDIVLGPNDNLEVKGTSYSQLSKDSIKDSNKDSNIIDHVIEVPHRRPGEISVEDFVDLDVSVSKQTILALRYLTTSGRYDF